MVISRSLGLALVLALGAVGIAHAGMLAQCAPNELPESKLSSFESGEGVAPGRDGSAERVAVPSAPESTPAPQAPDSGDQRADRGEAPAPASTPAEPGGEFSKAVRIRPSRWKALLPGALK